jgi:ankyrin repeat protein
MQPIKDRVDVIVALVEHGADLNQGCSSFTRDGPLGLAITAGHTPAVKLLLERGAHAGTAALVQAVSSSQAEPVCKLLLQHDVRDSDSHQALCSAVRQGIEGVVRRLLLVDQQTVGSTVLAARLSAALEAAAKHRQLRVLESLLADLAGEGSNVPESSRQEILNTALVAAVAGPQPGPGGGSSTNQASCTQALNLDGHQPASLNRLAAIKLLLKYGADPDQGGGELLLAAAQRRDTDSVTALMEAGASWVDAALDWAINAGHWPTVKELLSKSRAGDDQQIRALLGAAAGQCKEMVQWLLRRGNSATDALRAAGAQHSVRNAMAAAFLWKHHPAGGLAMYIKQSLRSLAASTGCTDLQQLLAPKQRYPAWW